jgi:hypothetical protein
MREVLTLILLWFVIGCAASSARSATGSAAANQVAHCEAASAPQVRDYGELEPNLNLERSVDVRFDPQRGWVLAQPLPVPAHYAVSIEWVGYEAFPELTQHERSLRFSFVVADHQLVKSQHEGERIDASYRLKLVHVCAP